MHPDEPLTLPLELSNLTFTSLPGMAFLRAFVFPYFSSTQARFSNCTSGTTGIVGAIVGITVVGGGVEVGGDIVGVVGLSLFSP